MKPAHIIKSIKNRLTQKKHPIQKIRFKNDRNLITLGSNYGGWTFLDDENLYNSTIISAGLGEDASFDIEFINKYNSKVIIIDPTPKSLIHFDLICFNIGNPKTSDYPSKTGKMPISSYNLENIELNQLNIIPKALWTEKTKLKFYKPINPEHVSHSISNFQNNYDQNGEHIEVETTTIEEIMIQNNLKEIPILKLDIESAEINVLSKMIEQQIFPTQIMVEFDELNRPSKKVYKKIDDLLTLLSQKYELKHSERKTNFLFVLKSKLS